MANVCDEQSDEGRLPNGDVRRGAENRGFQEGQSEVEICQLHENNGGAGRDGVTWRAGLMGQAQIHGLLEACIEGAGQDGGRLQPEEDDAVEDGDGAGVGVGGRRARQHNGFIPFGVVSGCWVHIAARLSSVPWEQTGETWLGGVRSMVVED